MYYNLKDSYVLYHVILPKVLAMHHLAEEKVIVDRIQVVEYKLTYMYFHCSSSAIVRKLVTEQTTAAHKKCWCQLRLHCVINSTYTCTARGGDIILCASHHNVHTILVAREPAQHTIIGSTHTYIHI